LSNLLKPLRALFSGHSHRPSPQAPTHSAPPSSPMGGGAACEEIAVHHLWSDQPNALKFQVSAALLPLGEKRQYASAADAADSPLAQAIFEAGGIASVELDSIYLTVLLEEQGDWDSVHQRLPGMIRKFFAAGGQALRAAAAEDGSKRFKFGFKQVTARPREEQMRVVQELFDKEVNPAVASHGGFFNLLDIQNNTVYVELGGGCQGCGMANVTLRQGVEARLREVMPEMAALVDQTDHAAGTNPFYQASKK